eukprot:TRINITY_DN46325_c0_g1_i1.p1 TRINITY_DN46325_c0_g1~~TRINITY_DN46325_c0_g1_i1.p1  ORF type:complete len:152 (+),score=51.84 TRINITY_DN46325_c0_g1_i1:1-456(+)
MEEVDQNSKNIIRMKGDVVEIVASNAGDAPRFTADKAIWSCNTFLPGNRNENCTQEAFYDQVGFPMLEGAFKGISGCVVAYGGQDSGKSYSLLGVPSDDGLIPRLGNDLFQICLLYTSDAADEEDSVDLGGRRIIKKKKKGKNKKRRKEIK